jgi:intracellular sulfur oxidation DsrE/DsrF family protein
LIENGVTIQLCSLYVPNKGISGEDLINGVTQAKSPLVAKMLLEHGIKVVTF